ncbi:hypothetical protein KUDE01_023620 [Dissostichus eleginoides]|uniref:Uncharacterized protein n=1 Tax=Dissostichus eleginoides TaxID=100907 RepID=A0AAD9BFH3_DISEL|nr:hypothetical protein KUDE01_023620 [Dissostichus eleginoides]
MIPERPSTTADRSQLSPRPSPDNPRSTHQPRGRGAPQPDQHRGRCSENFIMDPPAGDEGNLPVYNASDEEEVGEVRNAVEDEAPPRSGVFASTTPGFVFSTKRFREDDSKRLGTLHIGPRLLYQRIREDDSRDSAPSTLGLCCPMVPLLVAQRPPVSFWQAIRPLGVAPPEDSAPQVERPEEAPSSALHRHQASASPPRGPGKRRAGKRTTLTL